MLVNNAGISGSPGPAEPATADLNLVRQVFETNVFGVIAVTNAMLPLLSHSPAPRIVNVSSGVGSLSYMTDPDHYLSRLPGHATYPPSKTALNSLMTVQYAKDLRAASDCRSMMGEMPSSDANTDSLGSRSPSARMPMRMPSRSGKRPARTD